MDLTSLEMMMLMAKKAKENGIRQPSTVGKAR